MTQFILMQVELPGGDATLQAAARRLGVTVADLDAAYGLVPTDPDHGLYAVRVSSAAAAQLAGSASAAEGPFADVRIEPMGPPQR